MAEEQVPEYELLTDTFFAPNLVRAGSVVRTYAPPGQHMEPRNEAATAAKDAWYELEHPAADKDGKPILDGRGKPVMWKPNAVHRRRVYTPGENATVEILAGPAPAQESLSLAEMMAKQQAGTDQRPPPAHVRPLATPSSSDPVFEDTALVVEAAPPTNTIRKSA